MRYLVISPHLLISSIPPYLKVKMQACGRGFVTRRWFEITYRHAFLQRVEVPMATMMQSVARMRRQFVGLMGRKVRSMMRLSLLLLL
jgi:hypothetical protein